MLRTLVMHDSVTGETEGRNRNQNGHERQTSAAQP